MREYLAYLLTWRWMGWVNPFLPNNAMGIRPILKDKAKLLALTPTLSLASNVNVTLNDASTASVCQGDLDRDILMVTVDHLGGGGAGVPAVGDDVYFDSNSLTAPSIITLPTGTWYCKTLQFLDISKNPSFTGMGVLIVGP